MSKNHLYVVQLAGLVVGLSSACSERNVGEACYDQSQELADPSTYPGDYLLEYPICGIRYDEVDYPPGPDDEDHWISFGVCEDLESGEECQFCPAEEIDAKILAAAQTRVDEAAMGAEPEGCDIPVSKVLRGCVATPENQQESEVPRCCYYGWIWTACSLVGVRD